MTEEYDVIPAPSVPHHREAEEAVIGSILIDPIMMFSVTFLHADDFYIHRNKWLWEIFVEYTNSRKPIDVLTITDELIRRNKLEEIGGASYLTALINSVPSSIQAEYYAKLVQECSLRRKAITLANEMAKAAYDLEKPIDKAIFDIKQDVEDLEGGIEVKESFVVLGQVLSEVYDEIDERAKNPVDIWGVPSGLNRLDLETGGQHEGELTFLVGEPGVGKTFLALQIGAHSAKYVPTAMLSMELKRSSVARRLISGLSGVSSKSMRTGRIHELDWPLITNAIDEHSNLPFYLDYNTYDTRTFMRVIRSARRKFGIRNLIVDYAMMFTDEGKDDTERTGVISRNLKAIANMGLSVLCIHSVTKSGMDKSEDPVKSYMRGSGQQIHDADNVFFLTKYTQVDQEDGFLRQEETKRMTTLWCKKGREMEDSNFVQHLVRRPNSPFFDEYDREKARQARLIPQRREYADN